MEKRHVKMDFPDYASVGYDDVLQKKKYDSLEEGEEKMSASPATYTMQQAIDKLGFGRFQLRLSALLGLCYMCESMEIMLLSLLAPSVKCLWQLSGFEEAVLTTVTFVSFLLSSSFWGIYCDKYGRRVTSLSMALWTGYFGVLSGLAPNYGWLVGVRFLVGIGLGAVPQAMTFYSEYLPTQYRAPCLFLICLWWALGSCAQVLIGMLVLPTLGWRWFVMLSAVPLFCFACLYKSLPESARYYLAHGNYDKAVAQLRHIGEVNGTSLPEGLLVDPCSKKVDENRFMDLWHPNHRFVSILMSFIWFTCNLTYYGTVILTTALFEHADGCHGYGGENSGSSDQCWAGCHSLTTGDFLDLLITSIGDAPGIFVGMFLYQKFGRRHGNALLFAGFAVVMFVCLVCLPRKALVLCLFMARALGTGLSQGSFVYTAEVFPTSVRAIALGWGSTAGKLAVLLSPLIAQYLIQWSAFIPISIFAVLSLLGAVYSLLLPIETQGRDMTDTIDQSHTH